MKFLSFFNNFITQIFKYGFVGTLLNTLGFILFLILTSLGLEPKFVVAFMYPLIVLLGFKGHKRFTFSSSEETQGHQLWEFESNFGSFFGRNAPKFKETQGHQLWEFWLYRGVRRVSISRQGIYQNHQEHQIVLPYQVAA